MSKNFSLNCATHEFSARNHESGIHLFDLRLWGICTKIWDTFARIEKYFKNLLDMLILHYNSDIYEYNMYILEIPYRQSICLFPM